MPCEPFEMELAHRGFRREFHNAAGLVRNVTAGDTGRAAVVGGHIEFMLTAVHHHHLAEDKVVWPRLSARALSRAAEVNRMEDAHRAIADTSERVRAAAGQWAQTGDSRLAGQLVHLVEEFAGRVDEHFDDEESNVVPLIAEYLSPKEWRKFLAHGSAFVRTHPRRGLALGAIVLDGESVPTRDRFLGNVPLPVRTVYKMFGERVYAGYRAQVYGSE
jgi:hypothetical protein